MRSVTNDAQRAALQLLAAERFLRARDVLDVLGAPTLLQNVDTGDLPTLSRLLHGILTAIPEDLRPNMVGAEDGVGALDTLGTSLAITELVDGDGNRWVAAGVGHVAGNAAAFASDAADQGLDAADLLNDLNIRSVGLSWSITEDHVVLSTGAAAPLAAASSAWCALVGKTFLDVQHQVALLHDTEHPARVYAQAERLIADAPGNRFVRDDVHAAIERYVATVDPRIRPLVHVAWAGEQAQISVPFHRRGEIASLDVQIRPVEPTGSDHAFHTPGLHLVSLFPEVLTHDDGRTWCARFNDPDPDTGRWVHTTPWMLGNWRWVLDGATARVAYHGIVPNTHKGLVPLETVLDGVIREVWSSWDRFRLWEEFDATVLGGL